MFICIIQYWEIMAVVVFKDASNEHEKLNWKVYIFLWLMIYFFFVLQSPNDLSCMCVANFLPNCMYILSVVRTTVCTGSNKHFHYTKVARKHSLSLKLSVCSLFLIIRALFLLFFLNLLASPLPYYYFPFISQTPSLSLSISYVFLAYFYPIPFSKEKTKQMLVTKNNFLYSVFFK